MNKNSQFGERFIKLKHSINSCSNEAQLKTLSDSVICYHRDKHPGGEELLDIYLTKEESFSLPETAANEDETRLHKAKFS